MGVSLEGMLTSCQGRECEEGFTEEGEFIKYDVSRRGEGLRMTSQGKSMRKEKKRRTFLQYTGD